MTIQRRRFIAGLGALAAGGIFDAQRAAAQGVPHLQIFDLGNQGALYRIPLDLGEGRGFVATAAVLPRRSFSANIVQQQTRTGALTAVKDIAQKTHATVAINGGRFNGAFAPDGLLVVDGKMLGEKRADWIGYFVVDNDGNASVTAKPDLRTVRCAVQGNPLLVEPGGKIGIMREDNQRFRRTILAQSGDVVIAMVTTPVSLFTLAYALIERPGEFFLSHIDAALNMSGAATTSFYAKLADGEDLTVPAFWPNRDVITFAPRAV